MRNLRAWFLFLCVGLVAVGWAYQSANPIRIRVGQRSADPFVAGLSFREQAAYGAFRWSGPQARLFFRGIGAQAGTLILRCGSPLSGAVLRANGESLGSANICGGAVRTYRLPIQPKQIGPWGDLLVTLESDTFIAPPDPRRLGIQIVEASFVPDGGGVLPAPAVALYLLLDALLGLVIVRVWSGSAQVAWAAGLLALFAGAWGLYTARLEAAWLIGTVFWLGSAITIAVGVGVWLLKRCFVIEAGTLRVLGVLLLAALVVRIPFALTPGFVADVQDYVVWSYKLVRYGLASAYVVTDGLWIADYPPLLLYLFQGLGLVYRAFFAPDFLYPVTAGDPAMRQLTTNAALLASPIHRTLLRLPAISADLIAGAAIFGLAHARLSSRKSFLIAASYWFNPAVIYNSALWGQTDAVHTLLILLALALVEAGRVGWGFLGLALAGMTKPQAFVFGPLLLLRAYQARRWRGVSRAAIGGAAGLVVALAPLIWSGGPGAGALPGLLSHLGSIIGHHPVLSANAHNLWWFVTRGDIGLADTQTLFDGLSYRLLGFLLLALAYGLALAGTLRRPARDVWPVAAYVGLAFFILPTEIHENYSFAVLALLAVAMVADKRFACLYTALTLTMVANYALHDPNVFTLLHLTQPDLQLVTARWLNSALNVAIFGAWTAKEIGACSLPDPAV